MTSPAPLRATPWRQLLEEQDLVLSRRQARADGLTEDAWQWRLDSGRWQSVLPGIAVAHSGEVTARQRTWAAFLYAGPGAALSGDAALVEQGLRLPDVPDVDVAVPARRMVAPQRFRDGVVRLEPHRISHLEQLVHPVRLPVVVRPAPAALHAAAWARSDRAAEWRVAAVVQQRLVRPSDLRVALAEMPRLHRRALLREVLLDVEQGAHARSELDFLQFLRVHRLPRPDRLQRPVRRGRLRYLDAWWERQRVSAEIDGAHHRLVGTWEDDVLRANDVVVAERHDRIVLLRLTTGNLRHDGDRVADQLRAVLLP